MRERSYFPGRITAPLLLLFASWLAVLQIRHNSAYFWLCSEAITISCGVAMMSVSAALVVLLLASLATICTVWPHRYQRWGDGLFLSWGPAAQAAKTRVRSVFPFSLTHLALVLNVSAVVGVFIWLVLLGMAYVFYRSRADVDVTSVDQALPCPRYT